MNTYMKLGLVTVCCDYGYVNQVMSYSTYYSAFTLWTWRAKERNCYSYKVLWIKLNHMNDLKMSDLLTLPFTIMVPSSYKNSHCFKKSRTSHLLHQHKSLCYEVPACSELSGHTYCTSLAYKYEAANRV